MCQRAKRCNQFSTISGSTLSDIGEQLAAVLSKLFDTIIETVAVSTSPHSPSRKSWVRPIVLVEKMASLVRPWIRGSVQPVQLIADTNHRFVNPDPIRGLPADRPWIGFRERVTLK